MILIGSGILVNASDIDCLDHKRRDFRDDSKRVLALWFVFLHDVLILIFRLSHYVTKQKISTHKREQQPILIPPHNPAQRWRIPDSMEQPGHGLQQWRYLSTGGYWIGPQKTWPCVFRSRLPTPPCNRITIVIVHVCLMSWVRVRLMHMHLVVDAWVPHEVGWSMVSVSRHKRCVGISFSCHS